MPAKLFETLHAQLDAKYGSGAGNNPVMWSPISPFFSVNVIYDRSAQVMSFDVTAKINQMLSTHHELSDLPRKETPFPSSKSELTKLSEKHLAYIKLHFGNIVG